MKYTASCHCGKVQVEFESDLANVIECNCSHCSIKSLILTFVPEAQTQMLAGEGETSVYHFNKHVIDHVFCTHCGVQVYGKGTGPNGATMAINLRTVKDLDLASLTIMPFDGKSA